MAKTKWIAGIMILGCLAAPGWAQAETGAQVSADTVSETAEAAITLDQAQRLALETNKTFRSQLERERAARAKWWQAVLAFGPTGSFQGSHVLDNKPSMTTMTFSMPPLPPTVATIEAATNYYSGQLLVAQPVFMGFKLLNNLHLAELQLDIAKDTSVVTRTQLHVDVTKAFNNVLVSERLVQVTEASLDSMRKHLDIVKARYREGSASNYDVLRSEVQVANIQPGLVKLRTALRLARSNLATLIGAEDGRRLRLSGSLKAEEEHWAGLDELKTTALQRRLELKNLDRTRRMAEIGHTLAVTSNLPNVAVNAAWTYYDPSDRDFPPQGGNLQHAWQVGIGVNWPFWDNLAAIPKANEAAAKVREAELGRQALEDGIRLEVESAYLAMQAAKETIDSQKKTADLARESYRLAENQYRNGMATNIDVMDAQIALNQAEINYLQAEYDYVLAGIKLHQAVGDTF